MCYRLSCSTSFSRLNFFSFSFLFYCVFLAFLFTTQFLLRFLSVGRHAQYLHRNQNRNQYDVSELIVARNLRILFLFIVRIMWKWPMFMCLSSCVCVYVWVRACVRARARACVCVCERERERAESRERETCVCMCVRMYVLAYIHAWVCGWVCVRVRVSDANCNYINQFCVKSFGLFYILLPPSANHLLMKS